MITGGTYGDLGALKVTTDKFYRVNGKSTQLEGVKSDIVFPDRYAYVEMGEKDQDNPLSWDRITPANYKPSVMNNYDYAVKQSKKRLKENPIVSLIDEQALWVKKQQSDFSYYLDYDSFKTEMESKKNMQNVLINYQNLWHLSNFNGSLKQVKKLHQMIRLLKKK